MVCFQNIVSLGAESKQISCKIKKKALSLSYSKISNIYFLTLKEINIVVLKSSHYVQFVVYVKLTFFFPFSSLPLLCLFLTSTWRADGKSSSGWQFSSTLQERQRDLVGMKPCSPNSLLEMQH